MLGVVTSSLALVVTMPGPAALAGGDNWAWVTARIASGYQEYIPLGNDQGSQFSGAQNHVVWLGKGRYQVVMPNAGQSGGVIHVTPLGTSSHICTAITWLENSAFEEVAYLRCWDRLGNLANTPFVVNYVFRASNAGPMAYFWLDQPSASYTVTGTWNYNSTGGANHVSHDSVGHYTVTLGGLGANAGNVQVTAYGPNPSTCRVGYWGTFQPYQQVGVTCRNVSGNFADTSFNLSYINGFGLRGYAAGTYAYFWADQPHAATYQPDSSYRKSSSTSPPVVFRTGVGRYTVHLLGITTHGGSVQVTAYGTGKIRCQVAGIATVASPETVSVRCFKPDGTLTDSKYSFVYTH
jgi:hypothetical protein